MEAVIEMTAPRSRRPIFKPNRSKPLRSRWTYACAMGQGQPSPELAELMQVAPEIPGMCIGVDTQSRTARVFDPLLETQTGREIFARIKPILDMNSNLFGSNVHPHPTATRENMSHDDMKTWLYEMRKLVDAGNATVVSGKLPEKDQIRALPGKRQAVFSDPAVHSVSQETKYQDNVPTRGTTAATVATAGA